ncbi:rRNA maturation RNase YbeY [Nitrosomonas sp.]|uniref:rRNA maturation RNase YbeY n=1 Tax=Nitrosomonas sp. TaxID=42353 RepID=UPI0020899F68|nr:rRNA maturation RNase YbeY [Nitrosomonas sp.]GJL74778.1 MAG: endoribonuclease YbeY [Nitrosomonas sp.]
MEHSFKLTIQYAAGNAASAALPTRMQFRRWVKSALEQEAEIVIRIVDKFEGRTLNHDYRGKDYATNVLTFVYDDTEPLSGDVVLCAEVIENEARQQHKTLMAHYAHLTVHGLLHLQGYDHVSDDEATIMEKKETDILIRLGFNDPYAVSCEALISD